MKILYWDAFLKAKMFTVHAHVTWPAGRGKKKHIFWIFVAILPIHYTTFMGLRWGLGAVYRWKFYTRAFYPIISKFVFGPNFQLWGIFQGLDINFKFSTPKRHTLMWERIVRAITHKNLLTSLTWGRTLKKVDRNFKTSVIFHPFAEKPPMD